MKRRGVRDPLSFERRRDARLAPEIPTETALEERVRRATNRSVPTHRIECTGNENPRRDESMLESPLGGPGVVHARLGAARLFGDRLRLPVAAAATGTGLLRLLRGPRATLSLATQGLSPHRTLHRLTRPPRFAKNTVGFIVDVGETGLAGSLSLSLSLSRGRWKVCPGNPRV